MFMVRSYQFILEIQVNFSIKALEQCLCKKHKESPNFSTDLQKWQSYQELVLVITTEN